MGRTFQEQWKENLWDEFEFFKNYLDTGGKDYPGELKYKTDPNLPLIPYHLQFINDLPGKVIKILDVGAGALTSLGKKHPEKVLEITAIDPLATLFNKLLTQYNIDPPVKTIQACAEELSQTFGMNHFDFVNARNSLDHSFDPFEAIFQMVLVAKEGHYIVLNHEENVGINSSYTHLHQWNFHVDDGQLFVSGKAVCYNLTAELLPIADFELVELIDEQEDWFIKEPGVRWVRAHIKKRTGIRQETIEKIRERKASNLCREPDMEELLQNTRTRVLLYAALKRIGNSLRQQITRNGH